MNLAELLYASAERHPARPAVTDARSGDSLSYGALARETQRVAAWLRTQGVGPGHRIGLWAPNELAHLPAAFGLLASGACLVPLATTLTPAEMAEVMRDVQLTGWVAGPGVLLPPDGTGRTLPEGACRRYAFRWTDRDAEAPAEFYTMNPAFIRFTSGTTARSKGVVLSHEATAARVEAADRVLRFSDRDRILWVLPLAYHFAVTIVAYVRAGAEVLLCPDTLPAGLVEAARRFAPTVLYASPLHFERMASLGPGQPLGSVRLALSTSAPISAAVLERFAAAHGVPVGQAYGLIEAGLPCINRGTEGLPPTSVGRPVPGYAVAVRSDAGQPVAPGATGEIAVAGDGLFSAYYAPWQPREAVTRQGWFLTGDLGHLDPAGALHLQGRKKAVIFVAGLKFFPEEVEECINRFPGIRESRVFGRPHPHVGEVPQAEIVLEPAGCDVEGLSAYCARLLSAYKVPVAFTVVDAVPRTPSGKIRR